MSIEITGPAASPVSGQGGGAELQGVNPNGSRAREQNNSQAPADVVTITSSAAQLHAAEQGLKAVPVVDQERVERIRAAIQSGEYQIDPAKIADKFIRLETALSR